MREIVLFILSIFCIAVFLSAGCTDNTNVGSVETPTVSTVPVQKYSTGDIIAKDSTASSSTIAIVKYDSAHDSYEIIDVPRTDLGNWKIPANSPTRILTRAVVEKLYTVKIENIGTIQPLTSVTEKSDTVTSSQSSPQSISPSRTTTSITIVPTKDPDLVHRSVQQATTAIEIVGDISAISNPSSNKIGYISIPLALKSGDSPVDISKSSVVFQYLNNEVSDEVIASTIKPGQTKSLTSGEISENYMGMISSTTNIMNSPNWGILTKDNANSDNLLDSGERFTLGIGIPTTVDPTGHFIIIVKPQVGAALKLDIKTPSASGTMSKLEYNLA